MLELTELTKRFGGLTATDRLSMHVQRGELHAVIGPNGAGKTTLLNQLSGELAPDGGNIVFDGRDITHEPAYRRALTGLARSYQITSLFGEFTALENAALAVQAHAGHSFRFWRPAMRERALLDPAHALLAHVGLASRAHTAASALAHGERRQLEIAMALSGRPRLLLLDEPMAGMSRHEARGVIELLARLKGEYTIVLVEHDMDAVFALADRITVLVYGRAIATGAGDEIRASREVREAYLGDLETMP
jgi:branched-chain amino acid transport system ATP-binding protein